MKVGGGTVPDALRMLAMQPLLWAGAFALAMSYAQRPLPATASTLCTPPASILLRLATLHVGAYFSKLSELCIQCKDRLVLHRCRWML